MVIDLTTNSINNDILANEIKIFPNPVIDYLSITGINDIDEIILTTLDGKTVKDYW